MNHKQLHAAMQELEMDGWEYDGSSAAHASLGLALAVRAIASHVPVGGDFVIGCYRRGERPARLFVRANGHDDFEFDFIKSAIDTGA